MAEILDFTGITYLDTDPDRVLEGAKGNLDSVIVIGYDHEGMEYFASSKADGGEALWLLKRFEKKLLEVPDEESE